MDNPFETFEILIKKLADNPFAYWEVFIYDENIKPFPFPVFVKKKPKLNPFIFFLTTPENTPMLIPFKLAIVEPKIPTPNPFKLQLPLKFNTSMANPLMLSELLMKPKSIPLYLVKPPNPKPARFEPNERCILRFSLCESDWLKIFEKVKKIKKLDKEIVFMQ